MEEEIWKDIQGWEGFYLASNLGRIKSIDFRGFKRDLILKPNVSNKWGYPYVKFISKSNVKTLKVHRLVAQTFIPNPENKPEVNHINGIKTDNRVENLEWVTKSENAIHAFKIGLRAANNHKFRTDNPSHRNVFQFNKNGDFIEFFECVIDASAKTGIDKTSISSCALKRKHYNSAGGYVWRYENNFD